MVRLALIGAGAWSGAVGDAMMTSKKVQLATCFDVGNPILKEIDEFADCIRTGRKQEDLDVFKKN